MTMTSPTTTDPQVLSILETLRTLANQVKTIDNEIGEDGTSDVARRNKLAKEYVTSHSTSTKNEEGAETNPVVKLTAQVSNALSSPAFSSDELLVAVYTALSDELSKKFGKKVTAILQAVVDSQPKPTVAEVPEERKAALLADRSKYQNLFKLQKEMLKYISATPVELPDDIEEPTVRRVIGKRGAQFTKDYQLYYDGKLQQLTDNEGVKTNASLSNLVTKTKEAGLSNTKELRDYIIAQLGVTVSEDGKTVALPDTWSVTLPAPLQDKTISGMVTSDTPAVDESDDGDDDADDATEENAFASA